MTYEIRAKGACTPGIPTSDRPARDTHQAPLGGGGVGGRGRGGGREGVAEGGMESGGRVVCGPVRLLGC